MSSNKTQTNKKVMAAFVAIFSVYNIIVYTQGTSNNTPKMSEQALAGERLYQEKNCTACHQFYGLGGYLGPDLTNIISNENKGPMYVKAFLNSGIKSMPNFNFSEEEKEVLVQFLSEVDKTGYYPIKDIEKNASGWVGIKYKNQ